MKKHYSYYGFFLLTLYSIILIFIEIRFSQDFVRNFFTDIEGAVHFYAVNTSLSVFLLLATALIFAVSLASISASSSSRKQIFFYRSQVLFFTYLAFDDRFLIHEKIRYILNTNDIFIFLLLGIIEITLIIAWGDFASWNKATKSNFLKAIFCCALMIAIDVVAPARMIPRLSLEDLSKTWANVFLFLFSWEILNSNLLILKQKANLLEQRYLIKNRK